MGSATSPFAFSRAAGKRWLLENGLKELELLFRAIVYHPALPILIADNEGNYREASIGAGKLLGLGREKIIGRKLDDFADPGFKSQIPDLWREFLARGEQEGTLHLTGADGNTRTVEYKARTNVLPVRHVLALREKKGSEADRTPWTQHWAQDYALFLLDAEGCVAAWYSGAARIFGYSGDEIIGQNVSTLYSARHGSGKDDSKQIEPCQITSGGDNLHARLREEMKRCAEQGHFCNEGWQIKKDGTRFWTSVISSALVDEGGVLQGFARIVRDFSDRHERDEKLRRSRSHLRPSPSESTIAAMVSGEFDQISEANDSFLELVGYSRDELREGRLRWPDLTPPQFAALDELAHEEGLRFGACTPYEKELVRKDGTHVPVLIAIAVLKLTPFRWITFVTDLRDRDRIESVNPDDTGAVEGAQDFEEMVGVSAALKRVQRLSEVVAPTDATVLILGETGTGKELVARAIHRMSPRRQLPFITLNCAAIPTGLLESELFGYERGAFTGALSQKIGRFELANRGTLFLDEVGDIPLELQPKLLRALQEKAFERLGGTKTIPIDVRLVAATNRNLTEMMGDKLFRGDLYYRLKVFPITTPPLRDRPEDIPVLARFFTRKYSAKMDRAIERIPAETMKVLSAWSWPGNVRELENFIERSVILSRGPGLRAPLSELRVDGPKPGGNSLLEDVERDHILRIFRESDGVISAAATRLGVPRTTLNAMMKKLGISRADL
jgi:formate hydrogenlyase transcriptional activator